MPETEFAPYEITVKQGDIEPDIEITVKDDDGNVIDVTGYTVKWSMQNARLPGTPVLNDKDGEVVDGTAGLIAYRWSAADTQQAPGTYEGEFLVTPNDGNDPMHVPTNGKIIVHIEDRIGTVA